MSEDQEGRLKPFFDQPISGKYCQYYSNSSIAATDIGLEINIHRTPSQPLCTLTPCLWKLFYVLKLIEHCTSIFGTLVKMYKKTLYSLNMILASVLAIFYQKMWQEPGSCHSSCHFALIYVARTSSCHFQVARTNSCHFEDGKNQFLPHIKQESGKNQFLPLLRPFQMARTGSCHSP